MPSLHAIYTLSGETEIRDVASPHTDEALSLQIHDGGIAVSLVLPAGDEDAALVLELLEAAVGNAQSRVLGRKMKRERAVPGEEVVGWNGAGAAVEAARG